MKSSVKRWGNSVAIRIPQPFAEEVGIVDGTVIDLQLIDKKIIVSKPKLTLHDLLKNVTPQNIHSETNTGLPYGNELW